MTDKVVSIGPYQLGALDAFMAVVNLDLVLKRLPELDALSLFYSCMLQSGATRFDICETRRTHLPRSEFLRKRIRFLPVSKYGKSMVLIKAVFDNSLFESYRSEKRYAPVIQLEHFLTDLCFAMERKTSIVSVLSMPQIEELKHLLPPELFIPVRALMSALEPEQVAVPLPRLAMAHDRLEVFLSLLKSDLFLSYSAAHAELDLAPISKKHALVEIGKKANEIVRRNLDTVSLRRTTVSLLPVTVKLIDLVFGKLPGALAEYSTKLLTDLLNEQRRIVVYQFHPIFEEVIASRIKSAIETPPYHTKRK